MRLIEASQPDVIVSVYPVTTERHLGTRRFQTGRAGERVAQFPGADCI
jgi:hypothetical protein